MAGDSLSSAQPNRDKELTPLAQRLIMALRHVAQQHDELTMVVKGFERYMRRNGISDDDIRGGLVALREHIDIVLSDTHNTTRA